MVISPAHNRLVVPPQVAVLERAHSVLLISHVLLQEQPSLAPDIAAYPTTDEWAALSVDGVALDVDG